MTNITLNNNLKQIIYGSNENYKLIAKDDNIGENGQELTIVTLSCNRKKATIKQIESLKKYFPNFKGNYLIGDNGSSKETIVALKEAIKNAPFNCKIVEFGKNYGATIGRNKIAKCVKTKWFLMLDNDIYFTTNILNELRETIHEFGAHFINIPLMKSTKQSLYSLGGAFEITNDNGKYRVEGKSMFDLHTDEILENMKVPRSISNFLYATALMKTETFLKIGGFDENMFIGFEDIDFSIKLFDLGYKIATAGIIGAVHDHETATDLNDIEYEKTRFSNELLLNSAIYFEKKHGLKVWGADVDRLLEEKKKELKLDNI
ncbi:MAG: glycosyltransferase family 2 protein [Clostridia bacterium]|nr:glycosyltransferase family 2 protein [Clostridia bacterium]